MDERAPFEEFSVLLADESTTRVDLYERWLPGITTKRATTVDEVRASFDSTVAVAIFPHSMVRDADAAVPKRLLSLNPYCQLVSTVSRSALVSHLDDRYDALLRRPVFEDDLQRTVERRLVCGVYSATVFEFYHLSAELLGSRDGDDDTQEESADPSARVADRYRTLRRRLETLQARVDGETVRSVVESVEVHRRHLSRPDRDEAADRTSKYHPSTCPACSLPWGVDHRNDLGVGYERVGAHVWRCTRCNEMVHGLGASHRRVTW